MVAWSEGGCTQAALEDGCVRLETNPDVQELYDLRKRRALLDQGGTMREWYRIGLDLRTATG